MPRLMCTSTYCADLRPPHQRFAFIFHPIDEDGSGYFTIYAENQDSYRVGEIYYLTQKIESVSVV